MNNRQDEGGPGPNSPRMVMAVTSDPLHENFNPLDLNRITVETEVIGETITQTTHILGAITRKVIQTQDDQIRAALISLGWTPPPEGARPEAEESQLGTRTS